MLSDTNFKVLLDKFLGFKTKNSLKIGNNTYAYYSFVSESQNFSATDNIAIDYYGNTIARFSLFRDSDTRLLEISDCGWGTSTTRYRLNQILSANGIPYFTSQSSYVQVLRSKNYDDSNNYWWQNTQTYYSTINKAMFIALPNKQFKLLIQEERA